MGRSESFLIIIEVDEGIQLLFFQRGKFLLHSRRTWSE
jgi:hypothetical protein